MTDQLTDDQPVSVKTFREFKEAQEEYNDHQNARMTIFEDQVSGLCTEREKDSGKLDKILGCLQTDVDGKPGMIETSHQNQRDIQSVLAKVEKISSKPTSWAEGLVTVLKCYPILVPIIAVVGAVAGVVFIFAHVKEYF